MKKDADMKSLAEKLGDRMAGEVFEDDEPEEYYPDNVRYEDDEPATVEETLEVDELGEEDAYDRYISAKVLLPSGDEMLYGTVKSRTIQTADPSVVDILTLSLILLFMRWNSKMAVSKRTMPIRLLKVFMLESTTMVSLSFIWTKSLTTKRAQTR